MVRARRRPRGADALLVWGCLALLAPATAGAQLGAAFALEERQGALARVPAGKIIRLRLSDGGRAGGPVRRWITYSVTLGPYLGYAEQDTVLALATIDTLWLRGQATRRGALYGGAAGLALGAVLGATAASICPTGRRQEPCAQGTVTSAVAGLVIGGVAGAIVGSGNPEWQRLYPRDGAWRTATPSGPAITLEVLGDSSLPDPRTLALARIRPGRLVRLQFADRPDLAGYMVRAAARRAVLAPVVRAPADAPVPLTTLEAIWERGTAQRTGSVLGTLLGVGAGTYIAVGSTACDPGNACTATILGNGVLGGLVGWVVGGRVGSAIPRWQRRF